MLMGLLACSIPAQHPPPPDAGPSGFRGFGDPRRRMEMLADCLAEDVGLDQNQRKEMLGILNQAQTSANPLQEELQQTRRSIKDAIKAGKKPEDLESLHQQCGAITAKLAVVQSMAFAQAVSMLKDSQKNNADLIFDMLSLALGQSARPPSMMRPSQDGSGYDSHGGHGLGHGAKPGR